MRINNLNNVSFKSTMIMRATPEQINTFEDEIYKNSMKLVDVDGILYPDSVYPEREHITDSMAKKALEDFSDKEKYKNKAYKTKDYTSAIPQERFAVNITKLNGTEEIDGALYLVSTGDEAKRMNQFQFGADIFTKKEQLCREKLTQIAIQEQEKHRSPSETRALAQAKNNLLDMMTGFRDCIRVMKSNLEVTIREFSKCKIKNAKEILDAIKNGDFVFISLAAFERSHNVPY